MFSISLRSHVLLSGVIVVSCLSMRCTSQGKQTPATEPVATEKSTATPGASESVDMSLPPELRDVATFDPAATLDKDLVEESDFYKVKKEAEVTKSKLDVEWKAQDEQEQAIRKQKDDEEKMRQEELKKEEERKEESRKRSIEEYKKYTEDRRRNEKRAAALVKKMPTISKEDIEWNGLE
ncbi:MAG: hypothetical protein NT027_18675 [Proteobacteria bacterium]|nr:hypothetical protein [Pseudomonadota bacterium]